MALASGDIHRFTVDEYLSIVASSGDPRWDRTELIEGIVYDMSPEHLRHADAVSAVFAALIFTRKPGEHPVPGVSVRFGDLSLPQPDIVVYEGDQEDKDAPLAGTLVRLAVEVSVSSLAKDTGPKLALYARWGVAEYWLVVPKDGYLLRHHHPDGDTYASVERIDYDDLGAVVTALAAGR